MSIFPKSTAADLLRGRVQLNLHLSFAKTDPAKKQWFREGEMLPLDGRRRNRYVVNHRIIESLSVGMPQNKNRQVNVRKLMAVTLSGRITWRKKIQAARRL